MSFDRCLKLKILILFIYIFIHLYLTTWKPICLPPTRPAETGSLKGLIIAVWSCSTEPEVLVQQCNWRRLCTVEIKSFTQTAVSKSPVNKIWGRWATSTERKDIILAENAQRGFRLFSRAGWTLPHKDLSSVQCWQTLWEMLRRKSRLDVIQVENRKWGQRILKATVSVGTRRQSEKSTAQPHIKLHSTPLYFFSVILIVSFCIDCLICTQKITIHTWNTDVLLATLTFQPKYRSLLIYIMIYIIKHHVSLARTFEMPEVTHICSRYLSL